ncbi:glycoside hydrolase family 53 protein [Urechidicola croceus]|uniref:Arabinogalactan endo-beta-1,4-galactanase n=1 Tax=Urechidicola croceus TaxID=1850246 RepID=A0A1D8P6D1_9FLAO|nr:glycosyl hydrolase 53 family protein [Urechidicola croceus]AOW20131.1 arabinogalactan endo-1,4-beta-galactosidase [Urechidicola croceus]
MKIFKNIFLLSILISIVSCADGVEIPDYYYGEEETEEENNNENEEIDFYYGADLSYVNEMEDCGASYKNLQGVEEDPYKIFSDAGANLVRVRLWHNPDWTNYSNIDDVKKTIARAKEHGMSVLLAFHYSDTWADAATQLIPVAWEDQIDNTAVLGDLLYNYTFDTLTDLASEGLTPDIVQVGNETNPMILQEEELVWPIDWTRNSLLINKGISAVRDFSSDVEVMLHIAQPENGLWWFEEATQNGITDYDWIGLSYYPLWSEYTLNNVVNPLTTLIQTYSKRLMVVETAYPFTLNNVDAANNVLGEDALISGYPASQQGQLDYLNTLQDKIEEAGGEGLIYWEPAWVSTDCSTLWAQGSHWDNATLFDNDNNATLGLNFYNGSL